MFLIVFLSFMIGLGIFIAVKGLREWDDTNFVLGIGLAILFALSILGTVLEYSVPLVEVGIGIGIGALSFVFVCLIIRFLSWLYLNTDKLDWINYL